MEFEFFDKRSKKLYAKILQNDKNNNFKRYFNSLRQQKSFYTSNSIPDNWYLSLIAFQAIEFYLKYDKKQIKKIFSKFAKMASQKNKENYNKLIIQSNKIVNDMVTDKYQTSSNTMLDFEFEINKKIIKRIKIFLDVIGTGIYRISYNVYLQDEYNYKYWQILAHDFPNQIEIKKNILFNRRKIKYHDGHENKSKEINNFQDTIKNEIYKVIRDIAPGMFISLYKSIPIVMVLELDLMEYHMKIKNYLFKYENQHKNDLNNSFWEILRNDAIGGFRDSYCNKIYNDIYVPSYIEDYSKPVIFSKHFRNSVFGPTNLLFLLEILNVFYKIQIKATDDIRNNYLYSIISRKLFSLSKPRKNLYKIEALTKLISESYEIEERRFNNLYNSNQKCYFNNDYDEYKIEYFDHLLSVIGYNKKKIKETLPDLKDLYDKIQIDTNNKLNVSLQIIALILAAVMFIQTVQMCSQGKEQNQNTNNKENIFDHDFGCIANKYD